VGHGPMDGCYKYLAAEVVSAMHLNIYMLAFHLLHVQFWFILWLFYMILINVLSLSFRMTRLLIAFFPFLFNKLHIGHFT